MANPRDWSTVSVSRSPWAVVSARPESTDGGGWLQAPNSATAYAMRSWGPLNTQNAASTGLPDTTSSHLAIGGAYLVTGLAPSGRFVVTLRTETAGTNVTLQADSLLRYRAIT